MLYDKESTKQEGEMQKQGMKEDPRVLILFHMIDCLPPITTDNTTDL